MFKNNDIFLSHSLKFIQQGQPGNWVIQIGLYKNSFQVFISFFTMLNQSYFMCLFFFISAYFVPSSVDKRGATVFLKERFKRLGIFIRFTASARCVAVVLCTLLCLLVCLCKTYQTSCCRDAPYHVSLVQAGRFLSPCSSCGPCWTLRCITSSAMETTIATSLLPDPCGSLHGYWCFHMPTPSVVARSWC